MIWPSKSSALSVSQPYASSIHAQAVKVMAMENTRAPSVSTEEDAYLCVRAREHEQRDS
jgi:hypothetical protein